MRSRRIARRGIILLVTLSLLVLFMLIGITYLLTSSQFKQSAKTASRFDQFVDTPTVTADNAMLEIIRGSNSGASKIGKFSILELMYGDFAAKGTVTDFVAGTGSQLYKLNVSPLTINSALATKYAGYKSPGFFKGCVLTITNGVGIGSSTRIVDYTYSDTTGAAFIILPFDSDRPLTKSDLVPPDPNPTVAGFPKLPNATVLINGRPFSDLDYTAADDKTMFLSYTPATSGLKTIPSYHRPASGTSFRAAIGSNSSFDPKNGPWDICNDGSGIPDSVWVDIGLPAFTYKDGRQVKPYAAILVRELDGRLNVNAHGSRVVPAAPTTTTFAGGAAPTPAVRGLGVGPAEINLKGVLTDTEFTSIAATSGKGRYGPDNLPGKTGADYFYTAAGANSLKAWDQPSDYVNKFDTITDPGSKFYGQTAAVYSSSYGSPPDLDGRGLIGLDWRGQPAYFGMGTAYSTVFASLHYRVNFSPKGGRLGSADGTGATIDNLFTPAELEALLRQYDIDATSLPTRLFNPATGSGLVGQKATRANSLGLGEDLRHVLTTDSFHVPAPFPFLVDLARAKLAAGGFAGNVDTELAALLPRDILAGLPYDISQSTLIDRPAYIQPADPAGKIVAPYYPQLEARYLYTLLMLLSDPPAGANATTLELRARRFAQWAINAVAFKDPSQKMIPFVYHPNVFASGYTGWTATGNPADLQANSNLRIVWSCRQPDLLFSECVATHDRRCADTEEDANLREPSNQTTKTTPSKTNNDNIAPHKADDTLDSVRVPQGSIFIKFYCPRSRTNLPKATILKTTDIYSNSGGNAVLNLEKVAAGGDPVWRIAISAPTPTNADALVSKRLKDNPDGISLDPVSMSTVAGAAQNPVPIDRYITFAKPTGSGGATTDNTYYSRNAAGTAVVDPGGFAVVGPRRRTYFGANGPHVKGATTNPSEYKIEINPTSVSVNGTASAGTLVRGIVCGMDIPAGFNTPYIGANASEPLRTNYYPAPTHTWATWQDEYNATGVANYKDAYGDGTGNTYLDVPLDDTKGDLKANNALATGTYAQYRTVFLQRLADPAVAYNAVTNPYITVDWMPVDLTVFNGEDQKPANYVGTTDWDPADKAAPDVSKVAFSSRQRGMSPTAARGLFGGAPGAGLYGAVLNGEQQSLWPALSDDAKPNDPANPSVAPDATHNFACKLKHSLLGMNSTYGAANTAAGYEGSPAARPFPWLTFNNRPYVNAYELMLVPASSPSRLTTEFSTPTMFAAYQGLYASNPFGHLINFFNSQSYPGAYRLFEYVGVPSKFTGTETWFDSATFKADPVYKPPFNFVSNYREPGRINLNAISSKGVWDALFNGAYAAGTPTIAPDWAKFIKSRAGYDAGPNGTELYSSTVPSSFGGAFRSNAGVDATLLRPDPDTIATTPRPLFAPPIAQGNETDLGLRHAYFAFQGIMRLQNLTTTRSNVFAVWVTIGYFDGATEVGSDTGDVKRHRAFFIIDRSIPVGFERGQNHNVHKAILVQRYIE